MDATGLYRSRGDIVQSALLSRSATCICTAFTNFSPCLTLIVMTISRQSRLIACLSYYYYVIRERRKNKGEAGCESNSDSHVPAFCTELCVSLKRTSFLNNPHLPEAVYRPHAALMSAGGGKITETGHECEGEVNWNTRGMNGEQMALMSEEGCRVRPERS